MSYDQPLPGLWLRSGSKQAVCRVDSVVFDVDGVLIDTEASYPAVIAAVTAFYLERLPGWPKSDAPFIEPAETTLFKLASGFNSDWDLTMAAILYYLAQAERTGRRTASALRQSTPTLAAFTARVQELGGGLRAAEQAALAGLSPDRAGAVLAAWDQALIERLCCEFYGGSDGCAEMFGFTPTYYQGPGLYNRERPLLDPTLLDGRIRRFGLYTGRQEQETLPALRLLGLTGRLDPAAVVTASSPYRKPDPHGLAVVAAALGSRAGLFVGDNLDDALTVVRHRANGTLGAPFAFAGILGGAAGAGAGDLFRSLAAELIAEDVNTLLKYLQHHLAPQ